MHPRRFEQPPIARLFIEHTRQAGQQIKLHLRRRRRFLQVVASAFKYMPRKQDALVRCRREDGLHQIVGARLNQLEGFGRFLRVFFLTGAGDVSKRQTRAARERRTEQQKVHHRIFIAALEPRAYIGIAPRRPVAPHVGLALCRRVAQF